MTTSDSYTPYVATGNGSTDTFSSTDWGVIESSYLVVELLEIATGTYTLQATPADYTATTTSSTFSVVFVTPPPATHKVVISRDTAQTQGRAYRTLRGYDGQALEDSFDKLTQIVQERQDSIDRTIKTEIGSGVSGLVVETPLTDGELIQYESTGTKFSSSGYSVASIATAVSDSGTAATTATTQAGIATSAASAAGSSETAAAASAASAAAAAAGGLYGDVVSKSFADSPIVPLLAEEGTLYRIDTTGGAVVVNLSALSTYAEDVKFAFVRVAGSNDITINRGGSDTINGGTSITISSDYTVNVLVGDSASGSWTNSIQAANVADGDYGDISVSSGGTVWDINANAVDGTKIAMGYDAAGDILYYNGTDYVRLGVGTAGQQLAVNGGATAPEWVDAVSGGFASDNYNTLYHYDSFLADTISGYNTTVVGTGAAVAYNNGIGSVILGTGTTATGTAALELGDWYSNGAYDTVNGFELSLNVSAFAASDGTNTYKIIFGFADSFNGTFGNDAIAIRYTHSENSGNWVCFCRSGGTETVINTAVAPEIAVAHPTQRLKIVGTASGYEFFINNVSMGEITTNVPVWSNIALEPGIGVDKDAGATAAQIAISALNLIAPR